MALRSVVLFAVFLGSAPGVSAAQAMDCRSAALNHSEAAICASPSLRALDAVMDKRYQRVASEPGVQQGQLAWASLRDRCNANVGCLDSIYRQRNLYLAALPPPADAAAATKVSRKPLQHLFMRHAPAQLLVAPPTPSLAVDATGELYRAAGPARPEAPKPQWNSLWFVSGVVLVAILMWQLLTNVCGKCPNCHHWFARVEIDQRQLIDDRPEPNRRRRGLRHRASAASPSVIEPIHERASVLRHYHQCRMCLHEWETVSESTH